MSALGAPSRNFYYLSHLPLDTRGPGCTPLLLRKCDKTHTWHPRPWVQVETNRSRNAPHACRWVVTLFAAKVQQNSHQPHKRQHASIDAGVLPGRNRRKIALCALDDLVVILNRYAVEDGQQTGLDRVLRLDQFVTKQLVIDEVTRRCCQVTIE